MAFGVLGAFSGAGIGWIATAVLARQVPKQQVEDFVAASIPRLTVGGGLGLVAGLVFGSFLFKPRPNDAQMAVEQKYIGFGNISIYSGVPAFSLVLLGPIFEPLARRFGNTAAPIIFLLAWLVLVALSLALYDWLPRRLVMPLGLLGWVLTFAAAFWYGLRN